MHNQYTDLFVNLPEVNVQQIVEIDRSIIRLFQRHANRLAAFAVLIVRSSAKAATQPEKSGIRTLSAKSLYSGSGHPSVLQELPSRFRLEVLVCPSWQTLQYRVRATGHSHRVGLHRQAERGDLSYPGQHPADQTSTMVVGGKRAASAISVERCPEQQPSRAGHRRLCDSKRSYLQYRHP